MSMQYIICIYVVICCFWLLCLLQILVESYVKWFQCWTLTIPDISENWTKRSRQKGVRFSQCVLHCTAHSKLNVSSIDVKKLCKCSECEICLTARPNLVKTDLDRVKISEFYMKEIREFTVKSYKGLTLFA